MGEDGGAVACDLGGVVPVQSVVVIGGVLGGDHGDRLWKKKK